MLREMWRTPSYPSIQTADVFKPNTLAIFLLKSFILTLSGDVMIWPVVALKTEQKRGENTVTSLTLGRKSILYHFPVITVQTLAEQDGSTRILGFSGFIFIQWEEVPTHHHPSQWLGWWFPS